MGDVLDSIGSGLGNAANMVGNAVSNGVGAVGNAIGSGASAVGDALSGGAGDVSSFFTGGGSTPALAAVTGGDVPSTAVPSSPITTTPLPDISAVTPPTVGGAVSAASSLPNQPTIDVTAPPNNVLPAQDPSIPLTNAPAAAGAYNPLTPPRASTLSQLLSSGGLLKGASVGALAASLLNENKDAAGVKDLKNLAGQQGQLASSYAAQAQAEGEGLLPGGAEALVQNQLNAQISAIQQNYARMGMSGSSAETQDINAAKSAALAQTFQVGQELAKTGLSEVTAASGEQSTLLDAILNSETAQGTAMGNTLAQFAAAMAK